MSATGPTPERWARIEELFTAAVELPETERSAFLERVEPDTRVRDEVRELLAAHEAPSVGLLDETQPWVRAGSAAGGTTGMVDEPGELPDDGIAADHPERIGPYRIERLLGRGGMGRVYLATHEADDFRRHVAIKLVRRGLDTDDILRRFRAERRILASLDHPNIARLLDVGATPEGLPYLVMEYVDGVDILEHCRRRVLDIPARLALFRDVCAAVHHAHQRLLVHRDLKPGNIFVTSDGVPKLLDFGIAKILDPERTDGYTTRPADRLLTPRYSAPEQLRGERVTTACDIWALGVLLYELLADRHPFGDPAGRMQEEVVREILDRDPAPPRPSLRRRGAAPSPATSTRSPSRRSARNRASATPPSPPSPTTCAATSRGSPSRRGRPRSGTGSGPSYDAIASG